MLIPQLHGFPAGNDTGWIESQVDNKIFTFPDAGGVVFSHTFFFFFCKSHCQNTNSAGGNWVLEKLVTVR